MESNANTDADKLITFGQIALEQGWYEQAREYFEQALALAPSNGEAMKGLARVNEILSRKAAAAAKPIQVESVKPRPKVATTNKMMYGLAAILVLAVVVILVWIAYSMFSEPRREAVVAPIATAISTETSKPTPTLEPLPTPTQKEPTPTPVVLAETIFGEAVQRQIYSDYVEARRSNVGDKNVYEEIAQKWGTTVDIVKAIAVEGFKKNWVTPTATPVPPTPIPPTATRVLPTPDCGIQPARITYPTVGAVLKGVVEIRGTANCDRFGFYVLEYWPKGAFNWSLLQRFEEPVIDGILGVWDTSSLPAGACKLRVTVVSDGGTYWAPCKVDVTIEH